MIRRQNRAALNGRIQARSTLSIALREFCIVILLYGGVSSVFSTVSDLPDFIASTKLPAEISARAENGSCELEGSPIETSKLLSSIINLMLPRIFGLELEKYRLSGKPGWSHLNKTQTQSPGCCVSAAQPCTVRCCSLGILASVHCACALEIERAPTQTIAKLAAQNRIRRPSPTSLESRATDRGNGLNSDTVPLSKLLKLDRTQ